MNSLQNPDWRDKKCVCLISYANMFFLPFANAYIKSIENAGMDCVLLYWDREDNGGERDLKQFPHFKHYVYKKRLHTGTGTKLDKIKAYYGATRFFNKVLKEEKFDGVVVLHTHASIGCIRTLTNKYARKFIVDIRDFTLENFSLYRILEKIVFKKAYGAVISSPAYRKFLPDGHYIMAHNFTVFPDSGVKQVRNNYSKSFPLNIGFVGTVRFYGMDKKFLDLFGNDPRYQINYYGVGSDLLKEYADEKGIKNASFTGMFPADKILDYYDGVSLINNLYGNHDNYLDFALSNKLYHAVQLYIPLVVCPETYMEEVVNAYHLGFVVDVNNPNAPDILASEYLNFDWNLFTSECDRFIKEVLNDNKFFDDFRVSFLKSL